MLLGAPWLSRALARTSPGPPPRAHGSSWSIPGGSGPIPSRVATEFHQCDVTPVARRRPRHRGAVPIRSGSTPGETARRRRKRPSPRSSGTDLSEPLVARVVHRYAADTGADPRGRRPPCRSGTSSGTPRPDADAATGAGQPGRQRDRRRRVDRAGRRRLGKRAGRTHHRAARRPGLPPRRLGAGQPARGPRAPSSCSTTAGEGSSRSCRRRRRVEPGDVRAALRHAADAATSARWRAGSACPCTRSSTLSQLEAALAAPRRRPRSSGSRCPAGRRTSRCTMRSTRRSVSRCAEASGTGSRSRRRPVGLRKVSSTLASPEIFHPISWTQR